MQLKKCNRRMHKTGYWNSPAKFILFSADLVNISTESEHLTMLSHYILVQDLLSWIKTVRDLFILYFSFFSSFSLTQNLRLFLFFFLTVKISVCPFSKLNIHTCSETQSSDVTVMPKAETVMAEMVFLCYIYLSQLFCKTLNY